jgi:hypothetical protein
MFLSFPGGIFFLYLHTMKNAEVHFWLIFQSPLAREGIAMKLKFTTVLTESSRLRVKHSISLISLIILGILSMAPALPDKVPSTFSELSLSPEQQRQMQQLRMETKRQLSLILTPAQFSQFQASVQAGKDLQQTVSDLNLPSSQELKVRRMIQEQPQRVIKILTPEQINLLRRNEDLIGNGKMLNI